MNFILNISKLSIIAFFALWFIFLSNIGILTSSLVLIFSIIFVLFFLLNIIRPLLLSRLINIKFDQAVILSCLFIIITQYALIELLNDSLAENQSALLRGYLGIIFIFVTTANFKNTKQDFQNLRKLIFVTSITLFFSVCIQFFNPEYWNSIAYDSERFIDDSGQSGRAFGLMFNSLDLVFISGIFLVSIVIIEEKIGANITTNFTKLTLIIMLLLCFARSAYIILFLIFCLNPFRNLKIIFLLIPVAFFLYTNNYLYGDGFERLSLLFSSISEFLGGGSTKNRSDIILTIMNNAAQVPFFGLGLSGRDIVLPSYWRTHNFFLESFITLGVFGLVLLGIIWTFIIRILIHSNIRFRSKIIIFLIPLVSLITIGHVIWSFTFYFYILLIFILNARNEPINNQL